MRRRITNAVLVAGIQILVVVLAALAFNLVQPAEAAHAVRLEQPDRVVTTVRVTYFERRADSTLAYVELNDGSTWRLRPCKFEDGRHCYWDARARGNTNGRSFVVVRGVGIRTNLI